MNRRRYIDTHCHLFEKDFDDDIDAVVKKIEDTGVEYVLVANTGVDSIEPLLALEKKFPHFCKTLIGIHPDNVDVDYKSQIKLIEDNLAKHEFIGIGEIGLDYFESPQDHEVQKKILIEELLIARESHLPISMHIRDAFDDSLEILKKYQNGNLSGVIHCFTGNAEQAQKCLDLGFSLGIGGIVTFKKSTLPEVLKSVPFDKFVVETDSPCLAPVPFRGERNDSSFLPFIVERIAEIYGCSHEEVSENTTLNAKNIFNLK